VSFLDYHALLFLGFCVKLFLGDLILIHPNHAVFGIYGSQCLFSTAFNCPQRIIFFELV